MTAWLALIEVYTAVPAWSQQSAVASDHYSEDLTNALTSMRKRQVRLVYQFELEQYLEGAKEISIRAPGTVFSLNSYPRTGVRRSWELRSLARRGFDYMNHRIYFSERAEGPPIISNEATMKIGTLKRTLSYKIGSTISSALDGSAAAPVLDVTTSVENKSEVVMVVDTPLEIIRAAIGIPSGPMDADTPLEERIKDLAMNTVELPMDAKASGRSYRTTTGNTTRIVELDAKTRLPRKVTIVSAGSGMNVDLVIEYAAVSGDSEGVSMPMKLVWSSFVVKGGEQLRLQRKILNVLQCEKVDDGLFDLFKPQLIPSDKIAAFFNTVGPRH